MKSIRFPWGLFGILALLFGVLMGCSRKPEATPTPFFTPAATWTATPSLAPPISPSPSPPHERVYLPRWQRSEAGTVAPTFPTPATPAPPPTPTPTPAPTPFPPGPASKLGVFVGRNDPALFQLLRTGHLAVVKTLEYDPNFVTEIKQVDPDVFLVARYTPLPQPDFAHWDPIAEAHAFVERLLPLATEPRRLAAIDCWEAYNEPVVSTPAQMASLAQFEAERTRLLAQAGVRSCIGNFSAGQPPLAWWPDFAPALQAAQTYGGYLALHEYAAPTLWFGSGAHQLDPAADEGDEGWLTLRYRKVYRQYLQPAGLAIPLVITETGVDGGIANRPGPPKAGGWRDFIPYWQEKGLITTTPQGFYMEQLAWYDGELQKDPYVIGAAIFALAGPQGWYSFEIQDPVFLAIFQQYLEVHPQNP